MGEIYEATHARLAGRYAIKLLRPEIATMSEAYARFQREAKVTSALRHPNIVQVIDFSQLEESGASFLVMEFLDGPVLAEVIARAGGRLPLGRVADYVKQIASGLMAAHESGVVHRDLKPQNIFVLNVAGQDTELVKIVDFGISKVNDVTTTITSSMSVMGTAHYMSPEQARGKIEEIDARADQFSLAVMAYEMLTGEEAFRGDSVSSIVYQVVHEEPRLLTNGPLPAPVASVLKRALAKDKETRFPTVAAFASALEAAAAADASEVARTVSKKREHVSRGPEGTRRRRAFWFAAGAVLVAGGAALAWRHPGPARPAGPPSNPAPAPAAAIAPAAANAPAAEPPSRPPPAEAPPAPPPTFAAPEAPAPAPPRHRQVHRAIVDAVRRAATAPVSAATAPAARPDCTPNYYLGPSGEKHFKKECFVKPPPTP
jgi:serine/threonine-protein kinase